MAFPKWAASAADDLDPARNAHLGLRAGRAASYTILSGVVRLGASILTAVILGRLLAPADFGIVAMVLPLVGLAGVFADSGVSTHTLQRASVSEEGMSLTFWISMSVAILLTVLFAAASPLFSWFYDEPLVAPVALALSLTFVINGFRVQHDALAKRCLRQDIYARAVIVGAAASLGSGVIAALLGAGFWALVVMTLSRSIAHSAVMWFLTGWVPKRPKFGAEVFEILRFGRDMLMSQLFMFLSRNADKMLIGHRFGAAELGLYSMANNLMMLPFLQIQSPVAGAAVPFLTQLRGDPKAFNAGIARMASLLALAIWPIMTVGCVLAEPLIVTVLGEKWRTAAPIFAPMAIAAMAHSTRRVGMWSWLARGETGAIVRISLIGAVTMMIAYAAGSHWGGRGVATGMAIAEIAIAVFVVFMAQRELPGLASAILHGQIRPALMAIATGVAAYGALIAVSGASDLAQSAAGLAALAVVYPLSALALYGPQQVREGLASVRDVLSRRRGAKRGPEEEV